MRKKDLEGEVMALRARLGAAADELARGDVDAAKRTLSDPDRVEMPRTTAAAFGAFRHRFAALCAESRVAAAWFAVVEDDSRPARGRKRARLMFGGDPGTIHVLRQQSIDAARMARAGVPRRLWAWILRQAGRS